MPIYEYQCKECRHQLEALQKISDQLLTDCPQCGRPTLVKKVSAVAFRLAGSGWYETDFKSGDKKNLAGDTETPDSKSNGDSGDRDSKKSSADGNKEPSAGGNKEPSAGGNKEPSAGGNKEPSAGGNREPSAGGNKESATGGHKKVPGGR